MNIWSPMTAALTGGTPRSASALRKTAGKGFVPFPTIPTLSASAARCTRSCQLFETMVMKRPRSFAERTQSWTTLDASTVFRGTSVLSKSSNNARTPRA